MPSRWWTGTTALRRLQRIDSTPFQPPLLICKVFDDAVHWARGELFVLVVMDLMEGEAIVLEIVGIAMCEPGLVRFQALQNKRVHCLTKLNSVFLQINNSQIS